MKKNGFTILEMMIVLLVIAVLLMITLPFINSKQKSIQAKGCEALVEIVNSQILLYEIDHNELPTSAEQLITEGYLKEGQNECPDHRMIYISNGEAYAQ